MRPLLCAWRRATATDVRGACVPIHLGRDGSRRRVGEAAGRAEIDRRTKKKVAFPELGYIFESVRRKAIQPPSPLRMIELQMGETNDAGGDVTGVVWQALENARDRDGMSTPDYLMLANQAIELLATWVGEESALWLAEKLGLDADLTETNALYLGTAKRI